MDGAYCKACALFGSETGDKNCAILDKLVKSPITFWTTANTKIKDHVKSEVHKLAIVRAEAFVEVMQNQSTSIVNQLKSILAAQVAQNRQKLYPIINFVAATTLL